MPGRAGLLSFRLSELAIPVPMEFSGNAFAVQRSVAFLEGRRRLGVLDRAIDPDAEQAEGRTALEKVGVRSHDSGSTVAPLSGTLTWRFIRG